MNSRTRSLAAVSSSTPRSPCMRSAMASRQLGEERVHGGPPQLVLRAVVVVQQRLGHTGALGDLPQVVAPSNDRSENRSTAAARIRSRVGSADGRVARSVVAVAVMGPTLIR